MARKRIHLVEKFKLNVMKVVDYYILSRENFYFMNLLAFPSPLSRFRSRFLTEIQLHCGKGGSSRS